ncbi:MAG: hypothetical protein V4478_02805 [Patescibacteria group bacterium]
MKKILIVTNSQENAEHAKEHFKDIPGFECAYASTRVAAEALIGSVDMLITDCNIAYSDDDSLQCYPGYLAMIRSHHPFMTEAEVYAAATALNGWSLLLQAKMRELPSLMIGEYGPGMKDEMLTLPKGIVPAPYEALVKEIYKDNRGDWKSFMDALNVYITSHDIEWFMAGDGLFHSMFLTNWRVVWGVIQQQL